jgi:hypothetical protein
MVRKPLLPPSFFGVDESPGFPKFRDRITSEFWLRVHGTVGDVDCTTCNRVKVVWVSTATDRWSEIRHSNPRWVHVKQSRNED